MKKSTTKRFSVKSVFALLLFPFMPLVALWNAPALKEIYRLDGGNPTKVRLEELKNGDLFYFSYPRKNGERHVGPIMRCEGSPTHNGTSWCVSCK